VGIGTTNPIGQLDISTQAAYNAEFGGFHVTNNATTPSKVAQMGFDNNLDAGFIRAYQSSTGTKPLLLNPQGGFIGIATTTPTHALEVNGTARVTTLMFGDNTAMTTAAPSLAGSNSFTGNQTVNGNVQITGGGNSVIFADGTNMTSANQARVRAITYLGGCDSCSALQTSDSQNDIFVNVIGGMTVTLVKCFSDAGAPTINIRRRHTAQTDAFVLSSDLACSTTGGTGTLGLTTLNQDDEIDLQVKSVDNLAHRVTVVVKTTIN
jgi:hypothetical protein